MKLSLVPEPQPEIHSPPEAPETRYVIRSDGLFWRPNSAGYTASVLEAGLYSLDKVRSVERCRREPPDVGIPIAEALAELNINPEVLDALLIERERGPR